MVWAKRVETRTTFEDDDDEEEDQEHRSESETLEHGQAPAKADFESSEQDEDAIFAENRLLTASADGSLQEWDLQRLCVSVTFFS